MSGGLVRLPRWQRRDLPPTPSHPHHTHTPQNRRHLLPGSSNTQSSVEWVAVTDSNGTTSSCLSCQAHECRNGNTGMQKHAERRTTLLHYWYTDVHIWMDCTAGLARKEENVTSKATAAGAAA